MTDLHDEIQSIASELRHLAAEMDGPAGKVRMVEKARALRDAYRKRLTTFDVYADLFGDPAWHLLLDLYCERGKPLSVKSATIASGAPGTTALRWLTRLEQHGLIERRDDTTDRRRRLIALSPCGTTMMERYLASI